MRRGVGRVALAGRVFGVCLGHMGVFCENTGGVPLQMEEGLELRRFHIHELQLSHPT